MGNRPLGYAPSPTERARRARRSVKGSALRDHPCSARVPPPERTGADRPLARRRPRTPGAHFEQRRSSQPPSTTPSQSATSLTSYDARVLAERISGTQERFRVSAIRLLAETEGIFTEPAGGTTLAAAIELARRGTIGSDESVVVCITGNGYKTAEVMQGRLAQPVYLSRAFKEFEGWWDSRQRTHEMANG